MENAPVEEGGHRGCVIDEDHIDLAWNWSRERHVGRESSHALRERRSQANTSTVEAGGHRGRVVDEDHVDLFWTHREMLDGPSHR